MRYFFFASLFRETFADKPSSHKQKFWSCCSFFGFSDSLSSSAFSVHPLLAVIPRPLYRSPILTLKLEYSHENELILANFNYFSQSFTPKFGLQLNLSPFSLLTTTLSISKWICSEFSTVCRIFNHIV